MIHWDDFRTAYQLMCSGTLTAAGEALGVNHATVLRHINRLEQQINTKLFIRHQRGYQLTEAGHILKNRMPMLQGHFNHLLDDIVSIEHSISGNLSISTVTDFALVLNPVLKKFQQTYPQMRIKIVATDKRVPLESGEVQASLRFSTHINEPDLIAHKIGRFEMIMCASKEYVEQNGLPKDVTEYDKHKWILPSGRKQNIHKIKALLAQIPQQQLIYQSNSFRDIQSAVKEGMGIGPITEQYSECMDNLVQVPIDLTEAEETVLWFVYHKNVKNNQRVKALLSFLQHNLLVNQSDG